MLTDEQKREYMEVMHQYADLRSRLEKHQFSDDLSPKSSSKSTNDIGSSLDNVEKDKSNSNMSVSNSGGPQVVADPAAVNPIDSTAQDRLSALRAKLQI